MDKDFVSEIEVLKTRVAILEKLILQIMNSKTTKLDKKVSEEVNIIHDNKIDINELRRRIF